VAVPAQQGADDNLYLVVFIMSTVNQKTRQREPAGFDFVSNQRISIRDEKAPRIRRG
jgi:hypothetical protein